MMCDIASVRRISAVYCDAAPALCRQGFSVPSYGLVWLLVAYKTSGRGHLAWDIYPPGAPIASLPVPGCDTWL